MGLGDAECQLGLTPVRLHVSIPSPLHVMTRFILSHECRLVDQPGRCPAKANSLASCSILVTTLRPLQLLSQRDYESVYRTPILLQLWPKLLVSISAQPTGKRHLSLALPVVICTFYIFGVDIPSHSCVGVWQNNRVEIIENDHGSRTTPSYVSFSECRRSIGDAAKNQAARNPRNTYVVQSYHNVTISYST